MGSKSLKGEVPVEWGSPVTGPMELSAPSSTFQGLAFLGIGLGVLVAAVGVLILVVDNPIGRLLTLLGLPLYALGGVEAGVRVLVPGLLLLAWSGFSLARSAALRCTLTVYEQGIVVSRKGRDQAIAYAGVREFSLRESVSSGPRPPIERLFLLDFTGDHGRTRVVHCAEAGDAQNTFVPVLDEIRYQLTGAVQARLDQGGALHGPGWTLDARGLHLRWRGSVRLEELALVDGFEGAVSFWKRGEPMPFFSTSMIGPNAVLLHALARRRIDCSRWDLGPLGRVAYRLTISTASKLFRWMLAVLFLGLAGTLLFTGKLPWDAVLYLSIPALLLGFFLADCFRELRVHERGISQKFFRTRGLLYADIRTVHCGEIRAFLRMMGSGGPTIRLRLSSRPGGEVLTHVIGTGNRHTDALLMSTRELLTQVVAHRLLARLQLGEEVAWGPQARFTREGLVVRLAGMFEQGEPRLIPYETPLKDATEQEEFLLFVGDEVEPALVLDPGGANFHPGLKVLELLRSGEARALWDPTRAPAYSLKDTLGLDIPLIPLPERLPRRPS